MNIKEFIKNPPSSVVLYPHPALTNKVQTPSEFVLSEIGAAAEIMFNILNKYPTGVGLAANQVDLDYPMFIMRNEGKKYVCVDPLIIQSSKETIEYEEGCLSFPGIFKVIKRPKKILVSYLDENLKIIKQMYTGFLGRVFQHELDHLNAININDI